MVDDGLPGKVGLGLEDMARAVACNAAARTSRTITPAPSPMTNPSLSGLNGFDDRSGCSLEVVVRLLDLSNAAMASGCMHDSAPPATMTFASPKAMNRAASPMEWAPVVQAVVAAWLGPYGLSVSGQDAVKSAEP